MIKHIVMWRLKKEAGGKTKAENAKLIKEKLAALPAAIPEILKMEVGINFSSQETAYDAVLVSEFADEAALNRYVDHPAHQEVAAFVKSVREARAMADYVMEE
jgi:hypothetical protein